MSDVRQIVSRMGILPTGNLSTISLDKLWTYYEGLTLDTEKDLEYAETVRRIIQLRSSADGWQTRPLGRFFKQSDLDVEAGAGAVAIAAYNIIYTENAVPAGAFRVVLEVPENYEVIVRACGVDVSNIAAALTFTTGGRSEQELDMYPLFLTNALDNADRCMWEELQTGQREQEPWLGPGDQLIFEVTAEFDANATCTFFGTISYRRIPTWVGR